MAGHRFTCLRTGIYIIWKCCYLPNTRGIILNFVFFSISQYDRTRTLLHLPHTEDTVDNAKIMEALLGQVLVDVHQRIRIVTAGLVL